MDDRTNILNKQLLSIAKKSIARSIWKIRRELIFGGASKIITTRTGKIDPKDPTKYVDSVVENVILEFLEKQIRDELDLEYIVSTEEEGNLKFLIHSHSTKSEIDLIVFIDPVDFTESVVRGLDGSSLITFYSRSRKKIIAAVVGDVRDKKIYFACDNMDGAYSQYIRYMIPPENTSKDRITSNSEFELDGDFEQLKPSIITEINEAHINCLINKSERITPFCEQQKLIKAMHPDGRLYVVGGSLGLARVAAGILDAAIEFAKGFREWDAWPGIYLCQKAGVYVSDLEGNDIKLKLNVQKGQDIESRLRMPRRQKFIVAGNKKLGLKFVKLNL